MLSRSLCLVLLFSFPVAPEAVEEVEVAILVNRTVVHREAPARRFAVVAPVAPDVTPFVSRPVGELQIPRAPPVA